MQLYYWKAPHGNVGDDLNPWLWSRVFGEDFFDGDADERFVGVGSVLDGRHDACGARRIIVFGSGMRKARERPQDMARYQIRFVRGPHSAAVLGGVQYISDPAILVPRFLPGRTAPVPGRIGFVPYFRTPPELVAQLAERHGLTVVSPHMKLHDFVSELTSCEYVVAEAMHGAILADSYRIPWVGCRISNGLSEGRTSFFKWGDWLDSLGIRTKLSSSIPNALLWMPQDIRMKLKQQVFRRADCQMGRLLESPLWTQSAQGALVRAQDRILEEAEALKRDRSDAGLQNRT